MPTIERVHAPGNATRERLLDAAERLWAERGITAVSLREIRIAAGARNTAAVQFHFGNRDGLIDALIERHMPHIGARQAQLAAKAADNDTRALVEVLVRPIGEYLAIGPSERAWVKVMDQFLSIPDLQLSEMSALTPEAGQRAAAALYRRIVEIVPRAIAQDRIIMLADMALHRLAVYARLNDDPDSRPHLDAEAFMENLVDMLHAALFAPTHVSTEVGNGEVIDLP